MFEKSLDRKTYREAYRAIRLLKINPDHNIEQQRAALRLIIELIDDRYGMAALYAQQSFIKRHSGIALNWRLHDRLQRQSRAIKSVTTGLSQSQKEVINA